MATKSQRRKEKHKRKRREKKERVKNRFSQSAPGFVNVSGTAARHRERMARQTPKAWEGEATEDVAVFDEAAREALPSELVDQVDAVRESLQLALDSRGEEALERTAGIPRSSPLSEWRLFVRGLVPWMAGDSEAAATAWERLSPVRRPGRIATAMMASLRTDLDAVTVESLRGEQAVDADVAGPSRLDESLLYHAKLLRRVRFDRAAVRIAEAGVRMPEESKELQLGPKKLKWLKEFATEYRQCEPGLVAALERVALGRAYAQSFSDLFETATRTFAGPPHDRQNLLLTFFFYSQFANDSAAERRAEQSLEKYLTEYLPQNEELTAPLRSAIASQIHLNEALLLVRSGGRGVFDYLYGEREDAAAIRRHFKESVRAYPAHRGAHKSYVHWVKSKLENDRLTKPKRKPLVKELAQVMNAWSKGLPGDAEPRLWLADHLLETEQMEAAKPHVDWLASSRQDDPRVRATTWKWQLLEAMRLSRRKSWLAQVPARLDEAEAIWPSWLSRQWLPYLRAAAALRGGELDEYERQREQIGIESGLARDSLADACMMLGAAQRMRVPAADLKPLRAPVDAAVKDLSTVADEELLAATAFFWDLRRTGLEYPALRMHGSKIGKEIYDRFSKRPKLVLNHLDDKQVQAVVLWASEYRFWCDGYDMKLPKWYSKRTVSKHPLFVAAKLNGFLNLGYQWRFSEYDDLAPKLREAAGSERDPYYRYWFRSLADGWDDNLAEQRSKAFGRGFAAFSDLFEDDDDDDDDFLDFDCDCASCRAARRAYEAAR